MSAIGQGLTSHVNLRIKGASSFNSIPNGIRRTCGRSPRPLPGDFPELRQGGSRRRRMNPRPHARAAFRVRERIQHGCFAARISRGYSSISIGGGNALNSRPTRVDLKKSRLRSAMNLTEMSRLWLCLHCVRNRSTTKTPQMHSDSN
jgi:hypothetical protein